VDDVLFIFAHQDDEIGAAASLIRELRDGHRVCCAFLTDGAATVGADVRDAESAAFLARLGVRPASIAFVADNRGRVRDGELCNNLPRAERALRAWLDDRAVLPTRIYSLDWEGGHVDHDATHLIALSIAQRVDCPLLVYSLYNAYGRPGRFFRVCDFVPSATAEQQFRIAWRDVRTIVCAPFAFPSQGRTWMALGAGFIARTFIRRTERIRSAVVGRIADVPHPGPPLYETLFGRSASTFMAATLEYRSDVLRQTAAAPTG
jgi:hypothetical protein